MILGLRCLSRQLRSKIKKYILVGFILVGIIGVIFFTILKKAFSEQRKNNVSEEKMEIISGNANDEFIELELTYLGSAKVKDRSMLLKGEQECTVYKDIAKDYAYTYSYRLFSSKEEYDSLKKECGFYDENYKIDFEGEKVYVCSYGKKLQWMKYNPSWKVPSGGMVSRAGVENMDIAENYVFFYEFDIETLQYEYLADMIMEEKNPPDEFVNLDLTYVGCATFGRGAVINSGIMYEEEGIQFTNSGYLFITGRDDYKLYVELCEINEEDLDFEIKEGKNYVFSWGREIRWIQYNPARKNIYGDLMNRAGLDWNMKFERDKLFFYEYNYDPCIEGNLADMSIEGFD